MRTVVTGAAGFIGQAILAALAAGPSPQHVLATDGMEAAERQITGADLTRPEAAMQIVRGADRVIHLAALPGGSAEAEPALSAAINLHATLRLADALAALADGRPPRLVNAGSIAVFVALLPKAVEDATPVSPTMVYGAHEAAVELLLADMRRRGALEAISVRLPGVVGRPRAASGLKSAFMSDVFHAIRAGEPISVPVSSRATMWLLSPRTAAAALIHAASLPAERLPMRPVTLPALRVSMGELVDAIAGECSVVPAVTFDPDPAIEAQFGRLPPLTTDTADALGFRHDGTIHDLVATVLTDLRP